MSSIKEKIKLEIRDMKKTYPNGDGVEHINIQVHEGEFVTMLGPSGCGKSTILRTLGGFLKIDGGKILLDGQEIQELPPEKRPTAMVFQSYNLWPHMTVYENLMFGLKLRKVPKDVMKKEADDALKLVPHSQLSLEQCLEFIADDELVEVTPKSVRMRKGILSKELRMKQASKKK